MRVHKPNSGRHDDRPPERGESLSVTGWGDTDPGVGGGRDAPSDALRVADLEYVPNDACASSRGYSSIVAAAATTTTAASLENDDEDDTGRFGDEDYYTYEGSISDDMMCASGGATGGEDACQGDSGGGLFRLGDETDGSGGEVQGGGGGRMECCVVACFVVVIVAKIFRQKPNAPTSLPPPTPHPEIRIRVQTCKWASSAGDCNAAMRTSRACTRASASTTIG